MKTAEEEIQDKIIQDAFQFKYSVENFMLYEQVKTAMHSFATRNE